MKTVAEAFQEFLQELELTENQRDEAIRQHTNLREQLQQRMSVDHNFLSGSYARRTAVRPLHDIDVFLVLREGDEHGPSDPPEHVLTQVRDVLAEAYPGKTPTLQARSVNIEFSGTGIAYDVVPAFLESADVYLIPDADQARWIRTNPQIHAELSTAANKASNTRIKPLLKALKHAKNVHEAEARSFHLEVMSWGAASDVAQDTYAAGLVTLLAHLERAVLLPCPDPAGLGPDIRPALDRCRATQRWLTNMLELARSASDLAADGRTGEAHAKLRELFGERWPERGTTPKRGAAVIASGGVDGRGSSFG